MLGMANLSQYFLYLLVVFSFSIGQLKCNNCWGNKQNYIKKIEHCTCQTIGLQTNYILFCGDILLDEILRGKSRADLLRPVTTWSWINQGVNLTFFCETLSGQTLITKHNMDYEFAWKLQVFLITSSLFVSVVFTNKRSQAKVSTVYFVYW